MTSQFSGLRATALAAGFCWSVAAAAQVPPLVPPQITPGALGNETQRQQQKLESQQPAPQIAPQNSPVTGPATSDIPTSNMPAGTTFLLTAVNFDQSAFLSRDELNDLAKSYIGQKVNFDDLWALVQKINALYKSKGQVTARAVLPLQTIHDGVVHIALIEGKLGKIEVKGASRIKETFVRGRIVIDPGATVDVNRLTDQVVYFNRTNDAQLRALLQPGANFGETDIELGVTEPASDTLQLFVDNYGVDSTGRWEGGIYYRHSDLIGVDDRESVYGTYSHGGIDGTASVSIPIDLEGTRFSVSYERNHIDILEGQFQSLGITGSGQSGTVGVSRPLIGTEHWLVMGSFSGAVSTSSTKEPTGPVTDTTTYRGIAGASATYIGNGFLATLSPSFSFARSHNAILAADRDISLVSASGLAVLQLPENFSVRFAAAGQASWDKLLPADLLFQIGGATSVRGYASGTFAGDSGFYSNLELHRSFIGIAKGFDLFIAYDAGMVFSTSPAERVLDSIALGAEIDPFDGVTLSAGIGIPLRKALPDQDDYRLYVQLSGRI